ncbi:MAG: endolytic transglycosylase MltG [Treponema sp.]|nr:endolytic transglycosylase MltG [Treponema sp.]
MAALLWVVAIAAVSLVILIAIWKSAISPADKKENAISMQIDIPEGMTVKETAALLEEKKLIRSSRALYLAARFNLFNRDKAFELKSGSYTVSSSMKLEEIYMLLQSGNQIYISVVIPEGLTASKIGLILESKEVCPAADFKEACRNPELIARYSIPGESLEGYLFPDTYFFTPKMKAEDAVTKLVENFFTKIKSVEGLEDKNPEELYKILTLASIVEREYRIKDEAPLIASVFTNRLKHNIGLYSCATVEYVITEILNRPHPERITYKDLKIDSPYNTYIWAGLTPGPISNPGLVALDAACNPAKTNYYYFVLTDPERGAHTFSSNFDQHKAAETINYSSKD